MKRLTLIAAICLSMLTVSSRGHYTEYNRSVLYLGLSSPDKNHTDGIHKINHLFLRDIRKVLQPSVILTDLSEPYIYSRNTDLPSIAKSRRVRWIIHGTRRNRKQQNIRLKDVSL